MADFWCILFGIGFTATVSIAIYLIVERPQIRQHARYRRAQQDRVKGRGFIHEKGL